MVNPDKRRSRAEMFPIVEQWQGSGLNKTVFCKQRGIAKSVFYYWQKRHKEDQSIGGFVPIKVNNENRNYISSVIEITYPNGIIVRLPNQTSPAIVKQYLHF